MPIVSWIPVSKASFSFVPTPSVPATRYLSPVQQTQQESKLSERATQHSSKDHKIGINILLHPSEQRQINQSDMAQTAAQHNHN
jgi:hypothetical protein